MKQRESINFWSVEPNFLFAKEEEEKSTASETSAPFFQEVPRDAEVDDHSEESDLPKKKIKRKKKKVLYNCAHSGCDGLFTTLANKKRHERLHSGEKPFQCDYDGCKKNFARKYDLKVHIRTHTKEKPYICSINNCGKKFSRNSSLREHERNIHHVSASSRIEIEELQTPSLQQMWEQNLLVHTQQLEQRFNEQLKAQEQKYPESSLHHPPLLPPPSSLQQQQQQEEEEDEEEERRRLKEQRFQEQKLNQMRYHEQKLENMRREKELRYQQQLVVENKLQVNQLVNRFVLAQGQLSEFKVSHALNNNQKEEEEEEPMVLEDQQNNDAPKQQQQLLPPPPKFKTNSRSLKEQTKKSHVQGFDTPRNTSESGEKQSINNQRSSSSPSPRRSRPRFPKPPTVSQLLSNNSPVIQQSNGTGAPNEEEKNGPLWDDLFGLSQ